MGGRLRGYLPHRWPEAVEPMLLDRDGEAIGPFGGSYDVAGDGRLLLVPTPEHTRGMPHCWLRGEDHSWLLAGDLAHTAAEVERVAPAIGRWCRAERVAILPANDPAATARANFP